MARQKKEVDSAQEFVQAPHEKDIVTQKLRQQGCDAYNENGIIMVRIPAGNQYSKVKQMIEDIGYTSSWGVVLIKENKDDKTL